MGTATAEAEKAQLDTITEDNENKEAEEADEGEEEEWAEGEREVRCTNVFTLQYWERGKHFDYCLSMLVLLVRTGSWYQAFPRTFHSEIACLIRYL